MRLLVAGAAILAATVVASAPVSAARYLITVQGQAFAFPSAVPGAVPIAEVAALGGQAVFALFEVNTASATFAQGGPASGQGTTGFWSGSVQGGAIFVGGVSLISNANDVGGIFLVDNGGNPSNANARQDQATISSGGRIVAGALVKSYDAFGFTDPDIYLQSLAFGRTRAGDVNNLPTLVTDVTQRPDFPSFLFAPGGTPPFMSLQFRLGNPTSPTQIGSLPVHSISVSLLNFQVEELGGVPEPQSWAMLITGFGLVGATLRRRRVRAAA